MPTKSIRDSRIRALIALHSPNAVPETGLLMCPPEKSRPLTCFVGSAVSSLQSGLSGKNREIRACFVYSAASRDGNSLQSRLRGGEGGILLPALPASHCETYSSAIIPCVCAGYKHIRS